jgi:hypothetical protein
VSHRVIGDRFLRHDVAGIDAGINTVQGDTESGLFDECPEIIKLAAIVRPQIHDISSSGMAVTKRPDQSRM